MEDNRRTRKFSLIRDLVITGAQGAALIYAVLLLILSISHRLEITSMTHVYLGMCIVNTSFTLLCLINRRVSAIKILLTQLVEYILIISVNALAIYNMIALNNTYIIPELTFAILMIALVISVAAMIISLVASTLFSLITVVHTN